MAIQLEEADHNFLLKSCSKKFRQIQMKRVYIMEILHYNNASER